MTNKIRDSVHGFIKFTDQEKEIIDSSEFQRLRYIKQLALTNYVYPGAVHTRFEHSLGVMEISSRMFDKLCNKPKSKEMIEKSLKKIDLDIENARKIIRLSALMHDIGHLPFSHVGEDIIPEGKKHEDISVDIVKSLEKDLEKIYFKDITKYVVNVIQKEGSIGELKLLKDIISGNIDADRMDYLIRDSHHCGVNYGYFDYNRLIESLTVVQGISGGLDLAIEYGGIHALEALILARYYMFTQVYFHRTRRIYDYYLKEYMKSWKNKINRLTDVIGYDDISLINDLRTSANNTQDDNYIYAYRICNRRHHSMIYETSEFTDGKDRRKAEGIFKEMSNLYNGKYNFIIDHAKGDIHKFLISGTVDEGEEVYVIRNNEENLLTRESHIIREMPKQFYVVRLYVASKDINDVLSKDTLDKLRKKALKIKEEVR